MNLNKKVKTALDETRLLILGAQVLFGFQLQGVFQDKFAELSTGTRYLNCAGQILMALAIALLIAPSLQHQIAEGGRDTQRIQHATSIYAGLALLPFEISLGLSVYVVLDHALGMVAAFAGGTIFCVLAGLSWYGLGFFLKARIGMKSSPEAERGTPLPTRIEQMLTEARVVLPGAQALLGFQFTVMLTHAFTELPETVKYLHIGALCCVALAVILLMTPAALHRIAFDGQDTPEFFRIGSWLVIVAPAPLALGIACDLCVAIGHAAKSYTFGMMAAAGILVVLAVLWYAVPVLMRERAGFISGLARKA